MPWKVVERKIGRAGGVKLRTARQRATSSRDILDYFLRIIQEWRAWPGVSQEWHGKSLPRTANSLPQTHDEMVQ